MSTQHITVTVNGEAKEADVEPRLLLVHLLRDTFGLTGTHVGCDTSNCGACTVHVDGTSAKSCTMLAVQADGRSISTIEGHGDGRHLHPLQQAFWDQHGLQCGFCTPGMIMQAAWLLGQNADPSEAEIRDGISGNLCRCTGYVNIVKSIQQAAGTLRERIRTAASPPRRSEGTPAEPAGLGVGSDEMTTEPRPNSHQSRDRGHGPLRQAQGRPAVHPWSGRVHRRREPAGPALARYRAQPVCARHDQGHRRLRGTEIPGVLAVITGADLEKAGLHWMPTLAGDKQMVLPTTTVMYQAQEVAAVVATTKYIAADGVAAVLVDYEPLPVIVDPYKALEPDAFVLRPDRGPDKQTNHIWHWESGDAARPMRRSRPRT